MKMIKYLYTNDDKQFFYFYIRNLEFKRMNKEFYLKNEVLAL